MAISARTASLLAQRQGYTPYGSNGRIRLLTPSNNAVASIAKQTANSQLDVMVKNYNAGIVSNQDFKDFLIKMQSNPGLSEVDRADIRNQISDFDQKIQGDKLVANYNAAPDNSLAQLQAAQALSTYYKSRAGSFQPDTPNYIDSINSAGKYDQAIINIQKNINLKAQQNLRYIEEQKVNQIPSNTSENATAKAEKWKALYDLAVSQGDDASAQKYAAQYNLEITNAQTLSDKETVNNEKTDLRNILGSLTNDYHDGRINEQQYLDALAQISPRIDATGDYGLINTLNRTTDIIQKNLEKGGLNRTTTSSGLPVVLGKNKGGSGSGGIVTDWDQKDFNYSDNLRTLQKAYNEKKISTEQYVDGFRVIVAKRAEDIQNQIATIEETAQANPNTKIVFNGKKTRVADVLDSLYNEQNSLEKQAGAVIQGDPKKMVLVMVASKNDNGFSTYEVHNVDTLKNDGKYVQDSGGIFHEILQKKIQLTDQAQIQLALQNGGYYTDSSGTSYKVNIDKNGRAWYDGGERYAKIYEPHSSKSYDVSITDGKVVPSYDEYTKQLDLQAREATSPAALKLQADKAKQAKLDAISKTKLDAQNQPLQKLAGAVGQAGKQVLNTVVQAANNLEIKPAQEVLKSVSQAVPAVLAPIRAAQQNQPVNLPANTSIQTPKFQSTQPSVLPQSIALPKQISNAGTPIAPALKQVLNPTGSAPIKIAPSPSTVQKTPALLPKDQYSVANSLKKLASNLTFGLLKF